MLYKTIRNIHLFIGLVCCVFLAMYGVSAIQMAHSRWFNTKPRVTETQFLLSPGLDARPAAQILMDRDRLRGEVREVKRNTGGWSFQIASTGTRHDVEYNSTSGKTRVRTSRTNFIGMLNRIHHASGLSHTFTPANVLGLLVALVSLGLIVLGATGIFMWFKLHRERLVGTVLLVCSLGYALTVLILIRTS
jgi:hypothetical protein